MANNPTVNKVIYGNDTLIDLTDDDVTAGDVVAGKYFHAPSGVRTVGTATYADSPVAGGNATKTNGILYGAVDGTSTSTVFTATVNGLDSYYDGACVLLKNGIIASAEGYTIDVNNLGAKPVYSSMASASRTTTLFKQEYTLMFVYDSTRVDGGCWLAYYGYYSDTNTNTIGYQIRTQSALRPASDKGYRYRLWFSSLDGSTWIPANTSTSTNATAARTPNTRTIDPFGEIVYNSTNGTTNAGANLPVSTCWTQNILVLGYSFNTTGAALTLTNPAPVYLKCTPQSGGGVKMDEIVQALPSTADGKVYIFLGMAYDATHIELLNNHPVYYYYNGAIRLWTNAETCPLPATATPLMDGTAAVGTATKYAREDHVHPSELPVVTSTDNGKILQVASGAWSAQTMPTELPSVTSSDNGKVLTVVSGAWAAATGGGGSSPSPATANPLMDGTAAVGTSDKYAREDHVHPSDTTKANLASPALTGTPTAPTATAGTSTTQIATTAFVNTAVDSVSKLVFTSFSGQSWTTSSPHSSDTDGIYPYRYSVPCSGVTATMYPDVNLGVDSAISGIYSPICETYAGGIYMWASEQTAPTILSIIVYK